MFHSTRGLTVGGMIEVPAAALSIAAFLKNLDFISIGTNDLIQYTLAIDRTDDSVAYLYNPLHPAVLQLVALTIKRANRANIPVAVCGEMAGEVAMTRLLLGTRVAAILDAPRAIAKRKTTSIALEHQRIAVAFARKI